jgi:hypothetical protein
VEFGGSIFIDCFHYSSHDQSRKECDSKCDPYVSEECRCGTSIVNG